MHFGNATGNVNICSVKSRLPHTNNSWFLFGIVPVAFHFYFFLTPSGTLSLNLSSVIANLINIIKKISFLIRVLYREVNELSRLTFFFSLKAAIGTVTVTRPIMSVGLCLGVHKKNDIIHRCNASRNASRNALKKCPLKDRRKTGRKCWTQLLYDLVCLHFLFFHSAQPFPHSFQSCPGHLFEQMNYGKEF